MLSSHMAASMGSQTCWQAPSSCTQTTLAFLQLQLARSCPSARWSMAPCSVHVWHGKLVLAAAVTACASDPMCILHRMD